MAIAFLFVSILGAAIVPRVSVEQLVKHSQMIVLGRVSRSWTGWDSKHKYIWTHHEVLVTDVILGTPSGSITVSEPGGSLDGVNQQFSGTLPYAEGEDTILFLYRTPIGYLRTVGGPQGKFIVTPTGRVVGIAQAGISYVEPTATTNSAKAMVTASTIEGASTPLASLDDLNVAEFKARVRRMALPQYRSAKPK